MSIVMEGGLLLAAWDYSIYSTIAGGLVGAATIVFVTMAIGRQRIV
jgi:hypothetical protein